MAGECVVVTGASGFIGKKFIEKAIKCNAALEYYLIMRGRTEAGNLSLEKSVLILLNKSYVEDLLSN